MQLKESFERLPLLLLFALLLLRVLHCHLGTTPKLIKAAAAMAAVTAMVSLKKQLVLLK